MIIMPSKVYFIITTAGHVDSTHLSLKDLSFHLRKYGSFSQKKLRGDLLKGAGRVFYQLPMGKVLLKEENLKD